MTSPSLSLKEVLALACEDSYERVEKIFSGADRLTAAQARDRGASFEDIFAITVRHAREDEDTKRRLRLCSADFAAHVLHVFESANPGDNRPRNAIVALRLFARGAIDEEALAAARAASWAASWAAARAAARAASWAAAEDAARAAWSAAEDAARAAWSAARAAARAASWAAWSAASDAALYAEHAWQFDRLIERLSDNEPDDWPLPERNEKRPPVQAGGQSDREAQHG